MLALGQLKLKKNWDGKIQNGSDLCPAAAGGGFFLMSRPQLPLGLPSKAGFTQQSWAKREKEIGDIAVLAF